MNNDDQIPGAEMPENENTAIVVRDNPVQLMRQATDVAGVCKEIVLKTACNIQGKKYVKCEGWMAIATAHGCIASSREVQRVEGGFTAIGEIRRISDGVVLATAEGFVGRDEKRWSTADEYACRAMAQTRAISRACRAAFAHVVVMMDAGLSTTPFEEVPDEGFQRPAGASGGRPPQPVSGRPNAASAPQSAPKPAAKTSDVVPQVATEEQKARFVAELSNNKTTALRFFVSKKAITDEQRLEDLPLAWVPATKRQYDELMAQIEAFGTQPAAGQEEPWRKYPMPWGRNKDTPLAELEKNYLYGLVMNYEVEYEYNGKRKSEEAIAKDEEFRAQLDAAGRHYDWIKKAD